MSGIDWRSGPELDPARPRILADLCAAAQARAAGAIVIRDGQNTATWEQLLAGSARLAHHWRDRVAAGQRVVIIGANSLGHLLAELACWRLAAQAAPLYAEQGPARLRGALERLRPVLVVTTAAIASAIPHGDAWCDIDQLPTLASAGPELPWRAATPDTPCLILHTSGSSGEPRGVVLTHDNLCSQQAAFAAIWPEVGPGDRLAAYLPWHHSFGGLAERLWGLCRGLELTIVPGGGRHRETLLATIRAVQPTLLMSVPKLHRTLTQAGVLTPANLRWVFTAGATLGLDEERWYAEHGVPVYEGWGLTETSPSAVITPPGSRRVAGVVGTPIPGVAVGVDGEGRIFVAGPGVMQAYADSPQLTATIRHPHPRFGWMLDSGDLGAWTADGLRLIGRADQVVKLANGEKVALAYIVERLECGPIRHAVVMLHNEALVALVHASEEHSDAALLAVLTEVQAQAEASFMRLQTVYRLTQPVSCENGLLTPAHKVARREWIAAFAAHAAHAAHADKGPGDAQRFRCLVGP
jgi:long-subunit acyl-CoA synthetase (AMP-forming)